jgi:hypothetical protein
MFEKIGVNPWLKMWVEPRKTIQAIVEYNPKYQFPLLASIYGFPLMLQMMQTISAGQNISLFFILLISLVIAPFIGMLGLSIMSGLLLWTGRWLGGVGTFQEIRAAAAWSNVPNAVNVLLWLLLTVVFGPRLFMNTFAESVFVGKELGVVGFVFFMQAVISIWSFVILLQGLGQVQGFSAWRALVNVIIPFLLVMIAMWLLMLIIWQFMGPVPAGQ